LVNPGGVGLVECVGFGEEALRVGGGFFYGRAGKAGHSQRTSGARLTARGGWLCVGVCLREKRRGKKPDVVTVARECPGGWSGPPANKPLRRAENRLEEATGGAQEEGERTR